LEARKTQEKASSTRGKGGGGRQGEKGTIVRKAKDHRFQRGGRGAVLGRIEKKSSPFPGGGKRGQRRCAAVVRRETQKEDRERKNGLSGGGEE